MIPSMNMSGMQRANVRRLNSSWFRIPFDVPFHSYKAKRIRKTMPIMSVQRTRAFVHDQGLPPRLRPVRNSVRPVVN